MPGRLEQLSKTNAGADPHVFEGEHKVLTRRVTGGTWRKWAATQTAGRAVDDTHALAISFDSVGDTQSVGVVAVEGEGHVFTGIAGDEPCKERTYVVWRGAAGGIANADLEPRGRGNGALHTTDHRRLGDTPFPWAIEAGRQAEAQLGPVGAQR